MPIAYRVDSIEFSDGEIVELPADSVVAIVGPNNSGKSACLREIQGVSSIPPGTDRGRVVLRSIDLHREGTADDLVDWLSETSFSGTQREPYGDVRRFRRANVNWVVELQARSEWESDPPYLPALQPFMQFYAAAENRLNMLGGSGPYDPRNDAPGHPMQVLFADPALMTLLSDTAHEAFGTRLTLSQGVGINFDLFMGEVEVVPELRPSAEYLEAIALLPPLAGQGDGIRSFMGLMLALVTAKFRIIVVDEPEAFLHPPQARLLGRKLATNAPEGTQVFVATHSLDVLHGLLDPIDAPVTVIRLVRERNVNRPSVLRSEDIRNIWSDPLLRYSRLLEGLFHQGVVVAEGDSDCRFYTAILDQIHLDEARPPHDLLFVQSGGKQRFPQVLAALGALSVPVAAIADLDVLRDATLLRRIVEGLGSNWAEIEGPWRRAVAPIEQLNRAPSVDEARQAVAAILDAESDRLSPDASTRLRAVTAVESGWERVKRGGLAAVPQGDPHRLMSELVQLLSRIGLFVVPVGELERWVPDIGGDGPTWVAEVLRQRRHERRDTSAREFVSQVVNHFG